MGLRRGGEDFRKRKYEVVALTERKLKGNEEASWCEVNGIIASIQEMDKVREGVAVLLNAVFHSAVIDVGCVRILWITLIFQGLKFV